MPSPWRQSMRHSLFILMPAVLLDCLVLNLAVAAVCRRYGLDHQLASTTPVRYRSPWRWSMRRS
jgi:hypothetical protein